MIIHTAAQVDLVDAWSVFWSTVSSAFDGPLKVLLIVVGIGLIAFSLLKFVWDKRRGGSARQSPIWWTLGLGGLLIAPDILIPLALGILSWVINIALKVIGPVFG
ncbi:hypothetical protein [Agromyces humi]|uniref:hypothetical protein n=1 Tax=Agromyces humi TaxID=1766800 RepID=UPI0013567ABB|nr:hypothetical protein [Agromyces humi]